MEKRYQRYLFEYRFEDAEWAFEVVATSPKEAQDRLRAISWANYKGEVFATIPVGGSAIRRAASRLRSVLGL